MKKVSAALAALLLLGLAAVPTPALSAPTPNSWVTGQQPKRGSANLVNGTLSGTVYAAGSNGSKCNALFAESTDTAAQTVSITVVASATTYYVGTAVSIPIGSGTVASAPPVNLLSSTVWPGAPLDPNSNPVITLNAGDTLVATAGAVNAAKTITVTAFCWDY